MVSQLPYLDEALYPSSDGKPMAENTEQYQWIVLITENLQALFRDRDEVFVAGDLLWYPIPAEERVENEPYCQAPDTMVVFDRPKGKRSSYIQHKESGIAPQVVFEIWSPSNRTSKGREEVAQKFKFYEKYGVEEYYAYDPETRQLEGWQRQGRKLIAIANMGNWTSPLLQIRFQWQPGRPLQLYTPNGFPFLSFRELLELTEQERLRADRERLQKELERQEKQIAQAQLDRERQERQIAQAQLDRERQEKQIAQAQWDRERQERQSAQAQLDQERQEKERLAAYLRSLGLDPDTLYD